MREWVRVDFNGREVPGGAEAILGQSGCGPDVTLIIDSEVLRQTFVHVTLYVDDERLPKLLDLLRRNGVEWQETRRDSYTERELDQAPLVIVWNYPDCEVFGGPRVGTSYDMSKACLVCGTGARQTSALIIDEEDISKLENRRVASSSYSDIIVSEGIAEELEALGATGLSFRRVYACLKDSGRQIKLRWRQLCAARALPPMAVQTSGIVPYRQCQSCGRGGYGTRVEVPPRIAYHARDLVGIDDVHTTWEWFGDYDFNGNVSEALFPYPWFLASPKVMRVLRAASGKEDFAWIPVRVVED